MNAYENVGLRHLPKTLNFNFAKDFHCSLYLYSSSETAKNKTKYISYETNEVLQNCDGLKYQLMTTYKIKRK